MGCRRSRLEDSGDRERCRINGHFVANDELCDAIDGTEAARLRRAFVISDQVA
jgi:hypothetical protein